MSALAITLYLCGCIVTAAFVDAADDDMPGLPTPRWLRRCIVASWPLFAVVLVGSLALDCVRAPRRGR